MWWPALAAEITGVGEFSEVRIPAPVAALAVLCKARDACGDVLSR